MNIRRGSLRIMTLAVVVGLSLLGVSGVASAKAKAGCHKTHTCQSGGGTGGVTGADPPPMVVTVSPNPLVENGASGVLAIITVETSPSLAGQTVEISSSQLEAVC